MKLSECGTSALQGRTGPVWEERFSPVGSLHTFLFKKEDERRAFLILVPTRYCFTDLIFPLSFPFVRSFATDKAPLAYADSFGLEQKKKSPIPKSWHHSVHQKLAWDPHGCYVVLLARSTLQNLNIRHAHSVLTTKWGKPKPLHSFV